MCDDDDDDDDGGGGDDDHCTESSLLGRMDVRGLFLILRYPHHVTAPSILPLFAFLFAAVVIWASSIQEKTG